MDVYWSVEHCGWVRCPQPAEPLSTDTSDTWGSRAQAWPGPDVRLPQQRDAEPADA